MIRLFYEYNSIVVDTESANAVITSGGNRLNRIEIIRSDCVQGVLVVFQIKRIYAIVSVCIKFQYPFSSYRHHHSNRSLQ